MRSNHEPAQTGIPNAAIGEILALFAASDWSSLSITTPDLSITVAAEGAQVATHSGGQAAPARVEPAVIEQSATPAPVAPAPVAPAPVAPAPAAPAPPAAAADSEPSREGLSAVLTPVLGIFYSAEQPGRPSFVEVGATVGADDTVGIVEVMKLMNHVSAGVAGEVVEICVENGTLVEFEQPLMWIRPDAG